MQINDIDTAEHFFSELEQFGIKLGLDQTRQLFSLLGNPEKNIRFIHIAGTNGKGSVGAMLSGALSAAGCRTGFYSSPHLINIRERFRINGRAVSSDKFITLTSKVAEAVCELRNKNISPTYFEVTTALAALCFAEENVDWAVWETGMGGRLDATNIVTPEICVITNIALDHSAHLGASLEKIAEEKAGIIKKGIPVFCGIMPSAAERVIRNTAERVNAPCFVCTGRSAADRYPALADSLFTKVEFLDRNLSLAIEIIDYLAEKNGFDAAVAAEGIKKVRWPGRFHITSDNIIIDGAHNPQAAESLAAAVKSLSPGCKYSIIFASLKDKETINILKILATIAEEFIFPDIECSRETVSPAELAEFANNICTLPVTVVADTQEALNVADGKNILITGSLYLAGEALALLVPSGDVLNIYS